MNFGHCKIVVPTKPTALVSDLIKNVSSENTGKWHVKTVPVKKRVNFKTRISENNFQAEKRYKVMEKSKIKILTVKNKNGAFLFPEDRILEVIDDNEFLTADFSDSE